VKNSFYGAVALVVYIVGKSLATLGMWGALGWIFVREVFTSEIPVYLRVFPFLCGIAALPLYPIWVLGCWLVKVSCVPSKHPFWDGEGDLDGNS
jgi:uncharacterized MAPEG superfamily protein